MLYIPSMGRRERGPQERVGQVVGAAMGVAAGMTFVMVREDFDNDPKGPRWAGLALGLGIALAIFLSPRLRRDPRVVVVAVGLFPLLSLGSIVNMLDLDERLSNRLSVVAFLLSVAALYTFAFVYARMKREVDLLIMREASMFAFFATIIAAVVYGALVAVADAPDLSVAAVAIFAQVAWIVGLFIFERRYA